MANKKISELDPELQALLGSYTLPIVTSEGTKKITLQQLFNSFESDLDSDLQDIANLTHTEGSVIQSIAGHWIKRTLTQLGLTEAHLTLSDISTNNASTTKHGLLKKLDNDPTHFMNGEGDWATPATTSSNLLSVSTKTADYTVLDSDTANQYIGNPNTASQYGLLTFTLPTLADNHGKEFEFVYGLAGNANGGLIRVDGEGSEKLSLRGVLINSLDMFNPGDKIKVVGESTAWRVKECDINLYSQFINTNDETNREFGLCSVTIDTVVGSIVIGSTVVETGNNACIGTVINYSAPELTVYGVINGGVFTDNDVLTFSNGTTAAVNETTNNKNTDSNIIHNLGINADLFNDIQLWYNTSNSMTNAIKIHGDFAFAVNHYNFNIYQISTSALQLQTGDGGLNYNGTNGVGVGASTTDAYYKIIARITV